MTNPFEPDTIDPTTPTYHGQRLRAAAYVRGVPRTGDRRMGCADVGTEYVTFRAWDGYGRDVIYIVPNEPNIDYHMVLLKLLIQL